jgi:hypothetical protein
MGNIDEAERSIRRSADAGLTSVGLAFAHVAQARGDRPALVEWLARGLEPFMRDLPGETPRIIAEGIVGDDAARAQALTRIEDYLATQPDAISGAIPLALIWLGAPERALTVAEPRPTRNDTLFLPSLWTAAGRDTRTLRRFSAFAQRGGLAEFWDQHGAPTTCRKVNGGGGYVCE